MPQLKTPPQRRTLRGTAKPGDEICLGNVNIFFLEDSIAVELCGIRMTLRPNRAFSVFADDLSRVCFGSGLREAPSERQAPAADLPTAPWPSPATPVESTNESGHRSPSDEPLPVALLGPGGEFTRERQ
jgi:hypothetical protein